MDPAILSTAILAAMLTVHIHDPIRCFFDREDIGNDYGHVDNDTPSFAISLYKEYRGKGIGTQLMKEMLSLLKDKGYKRASLAVQKANYAVRMYEKAGFKVVGENDEEFIMLCTLSEILRTDRLS